MGFDLSTAKPAFDLSTAKGEGDDLPAPEQPSGPPLNILQRRMGLGKQGNTMEDIRHVVDTAGVRAGGYVTDKLAPVAPSIAAPAGYATNFLVNAATELPGALIGAGGAKAVASPTIEKGGRWFMQQALNPTSKELVGGANSPAAKAITTILEEGINVTPGGAAKLRGQIEGLRGEVAELIKNSPASVDKGYAASALYKTLNKFRDQVNSHADEQAILKAWEEFSSRWGSKIPVQKAQDLKSGTQGLLRDTYGKTSQLPSSIEAQQAMASGLREGIADAVPGVAERNAAMSAKHNVLDIMEPRAARMGNAGIAGMAPVAHSAEAAALMLAERNPWVKSLIARALYQNSGTVPTAIGGTAGAAASQPKNRIDDIIDSLKAGR